MERYNEAMKSVINSQVENNDYYNSYKNLYYRHMADTETLKNKIDATIEQLKELNHKKLESEESWHKDNKPEERIAYNNFELIILERLIDFLNRQLVSYKELLRLHNEERLNTDFRLTWNADNNILIDIFRQIKIGKKGIQYITNTNEEIAIFIKSNFDTFEKTSIDTITTQLARNDRPKKSENRIDI